LQISRQESIILTALEIINELGYQRLSTKEICKRQGISEGSLYKHFCSKNEILLGVLQYFGHFDELIGKYIKIKKLSPKEGILFFFAKSAEIYEIDPSLTAILNQIETFMNEPDLREEIIKIYRYRSNLMLDLINQAIDQKDFRTDVDSKQLVDILLGTNMAVILRWRINNFNFPLRKRSISISENILLAYCHNLEVKERSKLK